MQRNIVWKGLEYESLENCIVHYQSQRILVRSCILGIANEQPFKVDYRLSLDHSWRTLNVDVVIQTNNTFTSRQYTTNGRGQWYINNALLPEMEGCEDVDISLTPLTNTLPIRRLNLKTDERQSVNVLYIDVLQRDIRPGTQYYTCLRPDRYLFETGDGSFKAEIETDEHLWVKRYPNLFEMRSNLAAGYSIY